MSASERLLKMCHHPKVPVTAPFLLLPDEINCVCGVFKNAGFVMVTRQCRGGKPGTDKSSPFCSPLSCEFICSFLAGW